MKLLVMEKQSCQHSLLSGNMMKFPQQGSNLQVREEKKRACAQGAKTASQSLDD